MKKQLLGSTIAAVLATATALPAVAEDIGNGLDVSMNAAITTDYVWRGVSQTQGEAAIQGGLDISHESGLYVGVWASNVDYNDGLASAEFDYYVGYGMDVAEGVSVDVGYLAYTYTGDDDLNFSETYASVSTMGVTVGAAYSSDTNINDSDSTLYTYVSYEHECEDLGATLAVSAGNYDFKGDGFFGNATDYNDYSVSVSKSYFGADWAATWTDTDLSDSDCGEGDSCDQIIALSVSKSL